VTHGGAERGDGFAAAARLVLERSRAADPEPVAAFLARHEALREWLEPMLGRDDAEPAAKPASGAIGPFRLLRELGRGGVGIVSEARRGDDPMPLAVKVLAGFRALEPARVERFRREAALAAKLDHPSLVRVLASDVGGDTPWLAMEFVVGAPLDAVLQELAGKDPAALTGDDLARAVAARQHVPLGDKAPVATAFAGSYTAAILRAALQLAEGLDKLHAAGVIHRDIKPSNVLLAADGRVVLTDFGLARDLADASTTMTGDFAGTPNYVSPEQAMAKRVAVDHRTDLFSFGSTLYELLTLRQAFPGDSMPQVLGRILAKEPTAPDSLHRGLSRDLATVLAKLLEKDPDRRYTSAAALAADLRALLEFRAVAAQRASAWQRLRRWVRREPLRAALVGVIAATVPAFAVGAGYLWARADEIRAGRERLQAEQVYALVDEGYVASQHADRDRANDRFERALAIAPHDPEVAIGMLLMIVHHDDAATALQTLEQRFAASLPPSITTALRFAFRHRTGQAGPNEAADLPVPRTSFDWFLRGALDLAPADRRRSPGSAQPIECLERAVLASERPRLWQHAHWAISADAANDPASARRCAGNLLTIWPTSSPAIYFACLALRGADPERAEQVARDAVAVQPDDGILHWALAIALEQRRDLAGATDAMARCVALLPWSPAAHYALGRVWTERGDPGQALPAMQRALELSPRFVEAWLGIGVVQRRLGDLPASIASLQRAVELHGTNVDALFQYGQSLVQSGRIEAALPHLRAAATLRGNDPNIWHHVAFALFQTGDDAGGAEALHTAVACRPTYERGHQVLAMMLQERGTAMALRAALAAWVQALPDSVVGWLQYGRHCVRDDLGAGLQDATTAVWAAQRILALTSDGSADGWLLLGEARAALGQRQPARTAMQRALASTPPLSEHERVRCERLLAAIAAGDK
jgi:serine/threonine protein kinase/Tfp pilus assembly protein PilF